MAQHDYDIANQTFPSFRSDLNSVLEAINTSNSGTSRPTSAVAGTIWLDTTNATNPTLKLYDGADDISLATFDYSANTVNWIDSTVVFDIVNDTTPELGGDLSVNGNSIVSTSNGNITFTPDGTGKVVISGLSFPTSDGTDGQAIVTDGCGNLSFASVEGRTGTVDWDTTAKTGNFTAVSGTGYFVNTTSGAITLTLPASPSAGDIVAFKDYAFTFATNNLTVDGNGSPIGGVDGTQGPIYSTNGTSKTFIYVDGTKGWLVTNESTDTSQESSALYVTATGGTVTCCGDYKIHTFTGPGTFCVSCAGNACGSNAVEYLVVAGGGGGGVNRRGGGGAGGFRFASPSLAPLCYPAKPLAGPAALSVSTQGYPITVGAGATGSNSPTPNDGSSSSFSTITSAGGGGGFTQSPSCVGNGGPGGSGGGGYRCGGAGGTGNTPPVSPAQGTNGGTGGAGGFRGGGGGGALVAGTDGTPSPNAAPGGNGAGVPNAFGTSGENCGSFYYFSGGGGGGTQCGAASTGGLGGGGDGENTPSTAGDAGTTNTGGGGGGGGPGDNCGSNGGSGIVIIRYKYQ